MGKKFLFILTNILVITTIGIVLSVISAATGVGSYIGADGRLNILYLLVFSAVVGFVGSFMSHSISLDGKNDDGCARVKSRKGFINI